MDVEITEDEGGTDEAPAIVVIGGEGESVTEGQIERAERLAVLENRHDEHVGDYDVHVSRDEIEWLVAAGVDRKAQEFADLAAEVVAEVVEEIVEDVVEDVVEDGPTGEDVVVIEDLPTPDVEAEAEAEAEAGRSGGRIRRALDRVW